MNLELELELMEKKVWGNVCRSCDRPLHDPIEMADRNTEGFPRCHECAASEEHSKGLGLCHTCGSGLDDGFACLGDCPQSA